MTVSLFVYYVRRLYLFISQLVWQNEFLAASAHGWLGLELAKLGALGWQWLEAQARPGTEMEKHRAPEQHFSMIKLPWLPNWHATSRLKVLKKASSICNYVVDRFVSLKIWKLKIKNFEDIMEVLQFEDVFWLFVWHTKFHKTSGFYHHALAEAQM